MTGLTVVLGDRITAVARGRPDGEELWLPPEELERATGWELTPEGACREGLCIPDLPGEGRFLAPREDGTWVGLARLAALAGQPVAACPERGIWLVGERAGDLAARLDSLLAPDFTLPDFEGRPVTLSDLRGRKVLLLAWASW
jgi:hypothetical protein